VPDDDNQVSDIFLRDLALAHTSRMTRGEQASANPAIDAWGATLLYDQGNSEGGARCEARPWSPTGPSRC
jgi:hypothetical protein